MEIIVPFCIRGYHIYGEVWTAVMGEELLCERKLGNVVDRYAIAVKKPDSGVTVGHLRKKISRVCSSLAGPDHYFLQGAIAYSIGAYTVNDRAL